MSTALQQFSQPGHSLELREDITQVGAKCYVCTKSVLGHPAYTCPRAHTDIACRNFYLHKTCAKLPTHIIHHKHNQHRLILQNVLGKCLCYVCSRPVKVAYACDDCVFEVCVFCASSERMLHHEAHKEHQLILMNRKAFVGCDACGQDAIDSSYVCTACEFWIHKKCGFAASIIPSPSYHGHHHPLHLMYSIPEKHNDIDRDCNICDKVVYNSNWMYYCDQCTYFVHMKCATSPASKKDEDESDLEDGLKDLRDELTGALEDELEAEVMDQLPDSVQIPLDSVDSPSDLLGSLLDLF